MSLQRNIATGYDFFNGLLVLLGDRGMISQKRIDDDLRNLEGVDWITALKSASIRKLIDEVNCNSAFLTSVICLN